MQAAMSQKQRTNKLSAEMRRALDAAVGDGSALMQTLASIAACDVIGEAEMQPTVADSMRAIEMLVELSCSDATESTEGDDSPEAVRRLPYSVLSQRLPPKAVLSVEQKNNRS